jgi:hypothetical protein
VSSGKGFDDAQVSRPTFRSFPRQSTIGGGELREKMRFPGIDVLVFPGDDL